MLSYQSDLIELSIVNQALMFNIDTGFILKSKRKSPYFFNFGVFHNGHTLAKIGSIYAQKIQNSGCKGIPIATATAQALAKNLEKKVEYVFNRKEAKDHGEGGILVGASIKDKQVLIVDDVITAGHAINQSIDIIEKAGGYVSGIVVALNREERVARSERYQIPVVNIITVKDLLHFLEEKEDLNNVRKAIEIYRDTYGVH